MGTPVPARRALLAVALAVAALDCQSGAAPPLGEVLLVVDTDAPVPKLVERLRVDLFTTDGTWYATRDEGLPSAQPQGGGPSDWPVSFSIALGSDQAADVVVRLRAYGEGRVRDYVGERFQERPVVCDVARCASPPEPGTIDRSVLDRCCPLRVPPPPPAAAGPRLHDSRGNDVTPATEPQPPLTIDRLAWIHVDPGVVRKAQIVLRAACFGTMADIRDFSALSTCADTENVRTPLQPESVDADLSVPSTLAGASEQPYAVDCTVKPRSQTLDHGRPIHDEEVCVRGGAFVMGGVDSSQGDPSVDALPERVAFVTSFLMDRYEATVGRFRWAFSQGFDTGEFTHDVAYCTLTIPVGPNEQDPMNCITYEGARSLCQWAGGDLPTEAQWEYAASAFGRPFKTHYPWGDSRPACSQCVYGRASYLECPKDASGPAPVTASDNPGGDVTPGPGPTLVDLGGNVSEFAADTFAAYSSNCWLAAPLANPACRARGGRPSFRGGNFFNGSALLLATYRIPFEHEELSDDVGFRCVRPGVMP